MLSETTNCCSALKQPLMHGDWKRVCAKLFFTPRKPPNPDLQYNYTGCIAMCMVFQYLQHVYSTISFYFHWRAISDNQGQKCWQIWAKQTLSMGVLLKFQKNVFFVHTLISPLPLFNVEIRFVDSHVVTTLKRDRGSICEYWRLKNSRVEWNRSFQPVSQLLLSMIVGN